MLKNLSYKKKNFLLLSISFVFGLIIYYYAFQNTLTIINQCSELKQQLEQAENAPIRLAELKLELNDIEARLGKAGNFGKDFQQNLLEKISSYCNENNIILKEFPQAEISNEQDYTIETNIIVVEGSFVKILKLIYQMEQIQKTGKVAAVRFFSTEDNKTKRLFLRATLYLQNIKKK